VSSFFSFTDKLKFVTPVLRVGNDEDIFECHRSSLLLTNLSLSLQFYFFSALLCRINRISAIAGERIISAAIIQPNSAMPEI